MKYADLGSVSDGSLRDEDLLEAFSDALEDLMMRNPGLSHKHRSGLADLVRDAREHLDVAEGNRDYAHGRAVQDILNDLVEALEGFVPPYCYFGFREVRGTDIGFWPCMDQILELPDVPDDDENESFSVAARRLGEDCKYVNDHGNVTVYGADGSVILEI